MQSNYRRQSKLWISVAVALAFAGAAVPAEAAKAAQSAQSQVTSGPMTPAAAARLVNQYRAAYGLSPVVVDPNLNQMATAGARAMAAAGAIGHGNMRQRVAASGFSPRIVVENVAGGRTYRSLPTVMAIWRASPPHNANLLKPGLTRVGLGVAYSESRVYWSLVLGKPRWGG